MLSQMLAEMFNGFEQNMLEYMAAHYAASYCEYHAPIGDSDRPAHFPTRIDASELARVFNKTEPEIHKFFEQLEAKRIGTITIYKLGDPKPFVAGNISFAIPTIGEKIDDRNEKNSTWFFNFNETVLQCEILKPTADAWKLVLASKRLE